MSGRGTTLAGTYGGRRYRERVERKKQQVKEKEREFRKEIKKTKPKPRKIKDPKKMKVPHGTFSYEARGGETLAMSMLNPEVAKEIQMVVNTMPKREDPRYIMEVRKKLAGDEAEADMDDWELEEDQFDVGDVTDALHHEAGQQTEEGDLEYGASGHAQREGVPNMPGWATQDLPEQDDLPTLGEDLDDLAMGVEGINLGRGDPKYQDIAPEDWEQREPEPEPEPTDILADQLTQMELDDEETEAFGKELQSIADMSMGEYNEYKRQKRLEEAHALRQKEKEQTGKAKEWAEKSEAEVEERRRARGVFPRPPPVSHKWAQAGEKGLPRDIFGEPEKQQADIDRIREQERIREQDPEWQRLHAGQKPEGQGYDKMLDFAGTGTGVSGVADVPEEEAPQREWVQYEVPEKDWTWAMKTGKEPKVKWTKKLPEQVKIASEVRDTGGFLGGLAPKMEEEKRAIDYYKRTKPTKKDPRGKLKIGAKGLAPTEELVALHEGRTMDVRPGMSGKDIISGTRSRAIGEGKKQKEYKERMGWGDIKARKPQPIMEKNRITGEITQVIGPVRDPKTRKIKKDAQGKDIMEPKFYSSAGRKKKIEEAWGLERKGMGREDESNIRRDPWEGRRAVAKEPGKRFTRKKEAITKHKLYEKGRREEDPEYRPRDLTGAGAGFQYSAGVSVWDKKGKPAILQNEAQPPVPSQNQVAGFTEGGGHIPDVPEISDAEMQGLTEYTGKPDTYLGLRGTHPEPRPGFPSQPDAPTWSEVVPMQPLQATNPTSLPSWAPSGAPGRRRAPAEPEEMDETELDIDELAGEMEDFLMDDDAVKETQPSHHQPIWQRRGSYGLTMHDPDGQARADEQERRRQAKTHQFHPSRDRRG